MFLYAIGFVLLIFPFILVIEALFPLFVVTTSLHRQKKAGKQSSPQWLGIKMRQKNRGELCFFWVVVTSIHKEKTK
jgi:hypothetical protein